MLRKAPPTLRNWLEMKEIWNLIYFIPIALTMPDTGFQDSRRKPLDSKKKI